MTEKVLIGVDLGGTTVKLAFVSLNGNIIDKWEIPTNVSENGKYIVEDIANTIQEHSQKLSIDKDQLAGIGMGAPGFIEFETGFVYEAVNIGWKDFALKDELEKATALDVMIENDANIAALGEMWLGAGQGAQDILCLTLGTGVGGGVITRGDIVHGVNGMAGELGHITIIPEGGYQCNCGRTGCLETVTSATGIRRTAVDLMDAYPKSVLNKIYQEKGDFEAKDVFDAAAMQDELALKVVEKVTFYLGWTIANLSNTLNPEKIIIGGGVSKAGETLMRPLHEQFKAYALKRVYEGAEMITAQLGNDAGVIGGAWIVKTKIG